jgi:hypothetical protein
MCSSEIHVWHPSVICMGKEQPHKWESPGPAQERTLSGQS